MDFKAALQREIEEKKRKLQSVAKNANSVRQSDLERLEREEYLAKQRELEAEREAKLKEKLAKYEAKEEVKEAKEEVAEEDAVEEALNKEVERKLKNLKEPIRLFAESDRQRLARLRLLELRAEERSNGQRNDFNELLQDSADSESANKRTKLSLEALSSITEFSTKIDRQLLMKDRGEARRLLGLFVATLLEEWQQELENRSEEEKKSAAGRVASATHQQTIDYLKPFFKLLNQDALSSDILAHLVDIVGFLQDREYVRANDTYLRLSIGNAPWPIGVTAVGIHERSAHEKITTDNVAHVLNDEVTRKWIQSIKRLMTFCQRTYPPTDPSKAMG